MSTNDAEPAENSLDLINILLSTVIRPTTAPFNSTSYGVTDHQRHVYSIIVENGSGKLSSGSPVNQNSPTFKKQISTNEDGCPDKLKQIQEELKAKTEEVNDITINEFILQFGLIDDDSVPYILGCEGSTFTPSEKLEPFAPYLTIFTLFYVVESSVTPIQSQCITRGKSCSGGTQTIQRSKIIGCHISAIAQSIKGNNDTKTALSQYLKKRINTLSPVIMIANVPVCSSCFKFYSTEANQNKKLSNASGRELGAATLDDQNRTLIVRKDKRSSSSLSTNTASSDSKQDAKTRSSVPMVRPDPPPYQLGDITKSGLRVASNNSTVALELAKYTYKHNGLFTHVPPPKPEFHKQKK